MKEYIDIDETVKQEIIERLPIEQKYMKRRCGAFLGSFIGGASTHFFPIATSIAVAGLAIVSGKNVLKADKKERYSYNEKIKDFVGKTLLFGIVNFAPEVVVFFRNCNCCNYSSSLYSQHV